MKCRRMKLKKKSSMIIAGKNKKKTIEIHNILWSGE